MVYHVYHGSPNKFNDFSFDFIGSQSGTSGAGFGLYFSELENEALIYGDNIFQCTLNLKNNISNDLITFDKLFLVKLLTDLDVKYDYDFTENYGLNISKAIDNLLEYSLSDTEILGSLINAGAPIESTFELLCSYGYDHTIDNNEALDGISKHYIVYDLKAIQINKKYTLETR